MKTTNLKVALTNAMIGVLPSANGSVKFSDGSILCFAGKLKELLCLDAEWGGDPMEVVLVEVDGDSCAITKIERDDVASASIVFKHYEDSDEVLAVIREKVELFAAFDPSGIDGVISRGYNDMPYHHPRVTFGMSEDSGDQEDMFDDIASDAALDKIFIGLINQRESERSTGDDDLDDEFDDNDVLDGEVSSVHNGQLDNYPRAIFDMSDVTGDPDDLFEDIAASAARDRLFVDSLDQDECGHDECNDDLDAEFDYEDALDDDMFLDPIDGIEHCGFEFECSQDEADHAIDSAIRLAYH